MREESCREDDLAVGWTHWLIWRVPLVLIVAGLVWTRLLFALWIPAFAVMGVACVLNAARCGRTHCYVTGPLYLLAAAYLVLAALNAVPLVPGGLLLVVFGASLLAQLLEGRLGRYRGAT